jgi:cytoskeleton protein RodZ
MGLSLKQVSEITKVRAKYLEALEEDDYGVIPGPTFVKAYLRTYASVLRLDADYDLTLEQMRSRTMRGRKKRPIRNTRRGYTLVGVLAIVAVLLLAYLGSRSGNGEAQIDVNSVGGVTTTLPGEVGTGTTLGGMVTTTTSEAVYTGSIVLLRIVATADCFVIIQDTDAKGSNLFRGILKSGDEVTKQVARRYYVSIGKPEAVQIYINDRLYQSPAKAGLYYITETKIEPVQ